MAEQKDIFEDMKDEDIPAAVPSILPSHEYTLLDDNVEAADKKIAETKEQIGNLYRELYRLSSDTGNMSKKEEESILLQIEQLQLTLRTTSEARAQRMHKMKQTRPDRHAKKSSAFAASSLKPGERQWIMRH